jgi:hypothetical protein
MTPTNIKALEVLAAQRGDASAVQFIRRTMAHVDGRDVQREVARIIGLGFDGEVETVNAKLSEVNNG